MRHTRRDYGLQIWGWLLQGIQFCRVKILQWSFCFVRLENFAKNKPKLLQISFNNGDGGGKETFAQTMTNSNTKWQRMAVFHSILSFVSRLQKKKKTNSNKLAFIPINFNYEYFRRLCAYEYAWIHKYYAIFLENITFTLTYRWRSKTQYFLNICYIFCESMRIFRILSNRSYSITTTGYFEHSVSSP